MASYEDYDSWYIKDVLANEIQQKLKYKFYDYEDFFAVTNGTKKIIPNSPFISVQFKVFDTNEVARGNTEGYWIDIATRKMNNFNNSGEYVKTFGSTNLVEDNYFISLTVEDNGGFRQCSLTLQDSTEKNLENIILNSIISSNIISKPVNQDIIMNFPPEENFRIRFGYGNESEGDDVINEPNLQGEDFVKRTETLQKPVCVSPWLYFKIQNFNTDLTENGIVFNIQAYELSHLILDNLKILQNNNKIEEKPIDTFHLLAKKLSKASDGYIRLITNKGQFYTPEGNLITSKNFNKKSNFPDEITFSYDNNEYNHKINLFTMSEEDEADNGEDIAKYLSVSNLLDEYCKQVLPRFYYEENYQKVENQDVVYILNPFDINPNSWKNKINPLYNHEEDFEFISKVNEFKEKNLVSNDYIWRYKEIPGEGIYIYFEYKDEFKENKSKEIKIRRYEYRNSLNNIIKSANLTFNNQFGFLNFNVAIDTNGKNRVFKFNKSGNEISLNTNPKEIFINEEDEGFGFISTARTNLLPTPSGNLEGNIFSKALARKVAEQVNKFIYQGTIELMGDPFYLFDESLSPVQYMIYLNVYKKSTDGEKNTLSNISGFYFIKKITHNITGSGYTTNLEVQRIFE